MRILHECKVLTVHECKVLTVHECKVLTEHECKVLTVHECKVLTVHECKVLTDKLSLGPVCCITRLRRVMLNCDPRDKFVDQHLTLM